MKKIVYVYIRHNKIFSTLISNLSSVGLIKPGLGEELAYQRKTYGDIVYQPSSGMTQQYIVTKTVITDTSSDSSEVDMRAPVKRIVKVNFK